VRRFYLLRKTNPIATASAQTLANASASSSASTSKGSLVDKDGTNALFYRFLDYVTPKIAIFETKSHKEDTTVRLALNTLQGFMYLQQQNDPKLKTYRPATTAVAQPICTPAPSYEQQIAIDALLDFEIEQMDAMSEIMTLPPAFIEAMDFLDTHFYLWLGLREIVNTDKSIPIKVE